MDWPTWREAMHDALYGEPGGFFRRERAADHFRTSIHASSQFAEALIRLAREAGVTRVIDIGAGSGELLRQIDARTTGLELTGVEVASRPDELPAHISWRQDLPAVLEDALVVANEWLDNVPLDVAQADADGRPRVVHVSPSTGEEATGSQLGIDDTAWLDAWWPVTGSEPGERVEIGRTRDAAWADVTRRARKSVCVAVDYYHVRDDRPPFGTLSAYQHGRDVPIVPDGSRDITAHVALDSVAAAGERAGATATVLASQRVVLQALGVRASLPPRSLATTDPEAYVAALSQASEAAELLSRTTLGGFGWLVQSVGRGLPHSLSALPRL